MQFCRWTDISSVHSNICENVITDAAVEALTAERTEDRLEAAAADAELI